MKKILIYSGVVLVLALGWYFLRPDAAVAVNDRDFTIRDTSQVGMVFLADKSGREVKLQRRHGGWFMNGGQAVRSDAIQMLLTTLHRMTMRNPVPIKQQQAVMKRLATTGVKVEVYDRGEQLLKSFYVGGGNQERTASYMVMDGADTPYLVHIQGFNGYLTPRFTTDLSQWSSRNILSLQPNQIDQICVSRPLSPRSDFCIDIVEEQLTITNKWRGSIPYDSVKVAYYLDLFSNVNYEADLTGVKVSQDAFAAGPFLDISVKDWTGRVTNVLGFKKPAAPGQVDVMGNEVLYDVDRFYGVLNQQDTVLLQYFAFDPIAVKCYEFEQ